MDVVLISTYELGRQPFGLASPAAWLREAGAAVTCLDLAVGPLDVEAVRKADLVAFYVPMHTATRLAVSVLERVRGLNPRAHLCFYGLYAPVNGEYLRRLGVATILGGEFEEGLVALVKRLAFGREDLAPRPQPEPRISLARQRFHVPDRSGLPKLTRYAHLNLGAERRTVGYTEASRGCKHRCRHCPIVPVYEGQFRIVQRDVVLEDIRRQVAAGAEHITFGDPDFFNGIGHALALVRALRDEHPTLTYDVTIKVEHLLRHAGHLQTLRETGCLFVTTAVESIDNRVLVLLDKGHTREDFFRVVGLCREVSLPLAPTFVTFTPWTSLEGYHALLRCLLDLDLVEQVAPVQLAIRLLIPAGSKLMDLAEVRALVDEFDEVALSYPWRHPDPRVDRLHAEVLDLVKAGEARGATRREIFREVWQAAERAAGREESLPDLPLLPPRTAIPYMSEPWYC